MPQREFLGIYARELELTAELYAHGAYRRYVLAHEERRNFYTAYRTVSHEQHARFCRILVHHIAKARRAETRSHLTTNKLRALRRQFLQQLAREDDMELDSSATLRLHAPFIRSASPPRRGYIEEMGSISESIGMSSLELTPREQPPTVPPTQEQRDAAAQYWYSRAIGLGVEEQSALHSMQLYLSGERDDEVADLLRQKTIEAEQDTADINQRREDQAYRVLAEDTLRKESEQRQAVGLRHLEPGRSCTPHNHDETTAAQAISEDDLPLIKNLMWEIEELKRKVALLSLRDRDAVGDASQVGDDSSTEGESDLSGPAEGEAGPSNWLLATPDKEEWPFGGSGYAGQTTFPHANAGLDVEEEAS